MGNIDENTQMCKVSEFLFVNNSCFALTLYVCVNPFGNLSIVTHLEFLFDNVIYQDE